ncbi:MAG TPA: hypothetical protein P5250_03205 [Bacteroidales bacterium]|nr:hypothetical protein [Bacteroidales bacterium]
MFKLCIFYLIITFFCASCKNYELIKSKPNTYKSGNLTSKDYKRGRFKSTGKFASRNINRNRNIFFVPRSMPEFGSRDANISLFVKESKKKKYSATFHEYKPKIRKNNFPKPIKTFSLSSQNMWRFTSDIELKTKYTSGRPSLYGRREKNANNFNKRYYIKTDDKYLLIFHKKKSMHTYTIKKKQDFNFLFNTQKKQKKKEYRIYCKANKKKRKPEMELFDPKSGLNRKN